PSHNRTVVSLLAEARNLPSAAKPSEKTPPRWPASRTTSRPVKTSQRRTLSRPALPASRTFLSEEDRQVPLLPVASSRPSGETTSEVTYSPCSMVWRPAGRQLPEGDPVIETTCRQRP